MVEFALPAVVTIDEGGIRIGKMLKDYEGLLGGRPTRRPRKSGPGNGLANG